MILSLIFVPLITVGFKEAYKSRSSVINSIYIYEYTPVIASIDSTSSYSSNFIVTDYSACIVNNSYTSCNNIFNDLKSNISTSGLCNTYKQYTCAYDFLFFVSEYTYTVTFTVQQSINFQSWSLQQEFVTTDYNTAMYYIQQKI